MTKLIAAAKAARASDELLYLAGTAATATLGVCTVFSVAAIYLLL